MFFIRLADAPHGEGCPRSSFDDFFATLGVRSSVPARFPATARRPSAFAVIDSGLRLVSTSARVSPRSMTSRTVISASLRHRMPTSRHPCGWARREHVLSASLRRPVPIGLNVLNGAGRATATQSFRAIEFAIVNQGRAQNRRDQSVSCHPFLTSATDASGAGGRARVARRHQVVVSAATSP